MWKNEKSYWDVSRSPLIINLGSSGKVHILLVYLINGVCYFKSALLKVSAQDDTACMLSINACALYNGLEILLYETD